MFFSRACRHRTLLLVVATLAVATDRGLAAAEHYGQVTFAGVPVPGATVTASQGERQVVTATDTEGVYRLNDLPDGAWTIRVEMLGFATLTREVTLTAGSAPAAWALSLLPFDEITRGLPPPRVDAAARGSDVSVAQQRAPVPGATTSPDRGGFQRAGVAPAPRAPAATPNDAASPDETGGDAATGAADGFLINGSVNNGAASLFAQPAAFGNNRRRPGQLYNFGFAVLSGNSAWDSRPFSFVSQPTPKPAYSDVHLVGTFAGPLRLPRVIRTGPNLFLGYQHAADHAASTQSALLPTLVERAGDFSQRRDAFGRPVTIVDPATGLPFSGNVIPAARISPQAAALLGYYPLPNLDAGRFNYQAPIVTGTRQDSVQMRATEFINARNQVVGTLGYQRTATDTTTLFGFEDASGVSSLDSALNWTHRFTQFFSLRSRYQFTRLTTSATPYFANRINVSGDAGIGGNNQDPANWGPPSLIFSSVTGLTDALPAFSRNQTHAGSAEGYLSHGIHNLTIGGDLRRHQIDILAQQDPRGSFTFTGAATGSDFADFLLGIPHSSSIAFGNADKYLRAFSYDVYFTDDLRLSPTFTVQAGARWEYEAPITEALGRLVNLDVAPGFMAAGPVLATSPIGSVTGRRYSDALVGPDRRGIQPRVGLAWRPVPGSSLVIRAGYGIYRNTGVYQPIATLLAQQPPLSKTLSVETSADHPLTLANGFVASSRITPNTFAVDPDFRVGYAHNWQLLVQRDLPASLTISGTYLGSTGRHLIWEFLPNTYPLGAVNPCPECPAGFVYVTSDGSSSRHAGQFQLRRRLRNGLTATVQYTLSKAVDDAAAFGGAALGGVAIAQDWRNLDAECGPSNFDQRHLVTAQFQYTTGMGIGGGALVGGKRGTLFRGWTVTSQLTAGSGFPLTPVYLTSVAGTGVTGTIRPDVTGAALDAAAAGFYLNPDAYKAPAAGHWGTAGRNSATGPAQFALAAGIGRTFAWGERLNLDWRLDATNVLNRVTYASVNAIIGSPQFGLPTVANPMRKVQSSLRLRF